MRYADVDIINFLKNKVINIDPEPDYNKINGLTVDLHLSNKFRVFDDFKAPYIDLSGDSVAKEIDNVMGKEIVLDDSEKFFLHPQELVLAATKESVELPNNIVGWLDGRSSLARLGLMVHVTAHRIDPGWSGQIVLEFFNSGRLPLALKPGMAVAALSFEALSKPALVCYKTKPNAKYKKQIGPIASRIDEDISS